MNALQETRYRQRYLDLIMNSHVRTIFETRTRIISFIRRFFDARGFMEVGSFQIVHVRVRDGIGVRVCTGSLTAAAVDGATEQGLGHDAWLFRGPEFCVHGQRARQGRDCKHSMKQASSSTWADVLYTVLLLLSRGAYEYV